MCLDLVLEPFMCLDLVLEPFMCLDLVLEPFMRLDLVLRPFMCLDLVLEPFMCLDLVLEHWQSLLFQLIAHMTCLHLTQTVTMVNFAVDFLFRNSWQDHRGGEEASQEVMANRGVHPQCQGLPPTVAQRTKE